VDRAITEPTDRSTPSVPIASAMPSATMSTGATWTAWVRKFSAETKCGVRATLKSRSATTPA
jgi:hypothetical protein